MNITKEKVFKMDINLLDKLCELICEEYKYDKPIIVLDDIDSFGYCYRSKKKIVLNRTLCELNYTEIIKDLLKHEVAHLRYPNHGKDFEAECKRMGIQRHTRFDHPIIKTSTGIHYFRCNNCVIKDECNKVIRGCSRRL
jgi:predicted SprT family Zn-dependent metalloprotease